MNILSVKDLQASVEGKQILNGVNLDIHEGEVHVIMGPNGSGKSTLSNVLMGHPVYTVTGGSASFLGKDLLAMSVDERARAGMFLSFQHPEEVPGISNEYFLQKIKAQKEGKSIVSFGFQREIQKKMKALNLHEEYLLRHLNVGFSGGEKKKNEILQMAVLEPALSILDETDSGLDVDAIRIVYENINEIRSEKNAILIITHYSRILKYIKPDFIHLYVDGKIIKTGGPELATEIDEKGYEAFE